jgi:hypothetical protein
MTGIVVIQVALLAGGLLGLLVLGLQRRWLSYLCTVLAVIWSGYWWMQIIREFGITDRGFLALVAIGASVGGFQLMRVIFSRRWR